MSIVRSSTGEGLNDSESMSGSTLDGACKIFSCANSSDSSGTSSPNPSKKLGRLSGLWAIDGGAGGSMGAGASPCDTCKPSVAEIRVCVSRSGLGAKGLKASDGTNDAEDCTSGIECPSLFCKCIGGTNGIDLGSSDDVIGNGSGDGVPALELDSRDCCSLFNLKNKSAESAGDETCYFQ